MDPKVRNLLVFLLTRVGALGGLVFLWWRYTPKEQRDPLRLIGAAAVIILLWRASLSLWRRFFSRPKPLDSYGKWVVITGSTSGIGAEFADEIARLGLNLLLVSRSEDKLKEQQKALQALAQSHLGQFIQVRYLVYDFTQTGQARVTFYKKLEEELDALEADGVGVLINNVGTANEFPRRLEEFSDDEVEAMLQCNIFSQVYMTRALSRRMQARGKGCIISVSSGSGNHVGPFLAVYSATKAFMTQFSRSMHVECWESGVDFLVVTPFYIVSNLYKRKTGTIIAPLPSVLVHGKRSSFKITVLFVVIVVLVRHIVKIKSYPHTNNI